MDIMSRANVRATIRLALGLAVATASAGCEGTSNGKSRPSSAAITRVEVVRPTRQTVRRTVEEPGQIVAFQTTPIHARIVGYVRDVRVDIGARVKKGDVLIELSVPEVEADLQEKRAAVEQALAKKAQVEAAVKVAQAGVSTAEAKATEIQAGLKRTDADLVRWQQEHRRVEQLVNERATTGTLLDETRNKLRSAEASGDEMRAKIQSAEAALLEARSGLELARSDVAAATASIDVARSAERHAEAMLGYARIEAPFDGIVTRRDIDPGHLTVPGGSAAPMLVVSRSDIATVVVDVPESHATSVEPGAAIFVRLPTAGGKPFEGKVTRTAWALESKARTIRTESDFPDPEGKLRPGLYAYATIVVAEHRDVLTLPVTALIKEKETTFCVTVVDGKAVRKGVEIGLSDGTRTEILSGLTGEATVVKANAASLVDGQPVKVAEPERPTAAK
jgi:HlyD family secretion protein